MNNVANEVTQQEYSNIKYYTSVFIYIQVKGSCVARFYNKLIEYIFFLINNNEINNYYNNKRNKLY